METTPSPERRNSKLQAGAETQKWTVSFKLYFEIYIESVVISYDGWNFNSGNYLFTTDTK